MSPTIAVLDARIPHPRAGSPFDGYLGRIGAGFCPFLPAAWDRGALFVSEYGVDELAGFGNGSAEAGLFYAAVVHTEWLRVERARRAAAGEYARSALVCDNVVVSGSAGLSERAAKRLVDWPHWLLENLYSRVGVMVGKFWTEEVDSSADGRPVDPPPVTFLSVRNAIRARDPRLLDRQETFARLIGEARDDGRDVLAPHLAAGPAGVDVAALAEADLFARLRRDGSGRGVLAEG